MIVKTLPLPKSIMCISCTHIGNASAHEGGRRKFMEIVKRTRTPFIHFGDSIEAILPNDKRYMIDGINGKSAREASLLAQMDGASEWLKGGKDYCIGLIRGNHEDSASKIVGGVSESIAKTAGVPSLSDVAYLTFCNKSGQSKWSISHPRFGIGCRAGDPDSMAANKARALRNRLRRWQADMHCIGHLHQTIVSEPLMTQRMGMTPDGLRYRYVPISIDHTWYVSLPSMFLTYEEGPGVNYASSSGYEPSDIGWVTAHFDNDGTIPAVEFVSHEGTVIMEYRAKKL